MLAQSVALGCPYVNGLPDATCLCSNANFGYGIRDCSVAACGGADAAAPVIAYGSAYCASATGSGSGSSASGSATGSATGSMTTLLTSVSTSVTTAVIVSSANGTVSYLDIPLYP
jgi:hypothetical protein